MRYLVLATDYDGTIATRGVVPESTVKALETLRESGRRLVLVTGRHLPDLKTVFPRLDLFDRVVAENGGLLYRPGENQEHPLADAPPEAFIERLRQRGVPFEVGRGIVATVEPHETEVLQAIKELGIEWHVIFNKGAVMVLPSGVNKATGLHCALDELGISEHNVVAVGDAENDHAFIAACEFGVAVSNALEPLKEHADLVTNGARGAGVEELVSQMLEDDLERYDQKLRRHAIVVGHTEHPRAEVALSPFRGSVLIAGTSGSGKSTVSAALLERLMNRGYQFCLIDPEGDYENVPDAIVFGTATNPPNPSEVLKALSRPAQNVVVNLLAIPLADRPMFCAALLPSLLERRTPTARPHFIFIDEAHHLLPSSWRPAATLVPQAISGLVLITVHPDWVAASALEDVKTVIVTGKQPAETFANFARSIGIKPPAVDAADLAPGTAAIWTPTSCDSCVTAAVIEPSRIERRRHTRKYATGELAPDRSFYFKGPDGKLNLRAQNLMTFLQLADGVDDETWLHHLRAGDYSHWFREYIKDEQLADEVQPVEQEQRPDPSQSRQRIREAIERRYTAAA
jgi:hydroxymethylpyrimidine pyrophosphatase-like HAD family hydrolase